MRPDRFQDPNVEHLGHVLSYEPSTGIGFIRPEPEADAGYSESARSVSEKAVVGQRVKFRRGAWKGDDRLIVKGMVVRFNVDVSAARSPDELWAEARSVWLDDEEGATVAWEKAGANAPAEGSDEEMAQYDWAVKQFGSEDSGF